MQLRRDRSESGKSCAVARRAGRIKTIPQCHRALTAAGGAEDHSHKIPANAPIEPITMSTRVLMHAATSQIKTASALESTGTSTVNPMEFLAFTLGQEEYGIDIQKVQELRGYESVTRIANAPDFIKGVVNLRGVIAPIIDMRIKFNLGAPVYDQFTVVIILNIAGRTMGMVVDSVSDVITLTPQQVKPPPAMGAALDTDYLIGLGTLDERMLILVDIERLMSSTEMGLIERLAA